MSTAASQPGSEASGDGAPPLRPPNQYHLTGHGISVTYWPEGRGPIGPIGAIHLDYQDDHQAKSFPADQVRVASVGDLGTLVSVTLVSTIDTGGTTFTLLLPNVSLAGGVGASAHIATEAITTTHRVGAGQIGHAQHESYHVTRLTGTAVNGILPA